MSAAAKLVSYGEPATFLQQAPDQFTHPLQHQRWTVLKGLEAFSKAYKIFPEKVLKLTGDYAGIEADTVAFGPREWREHYNVAVGEDQLPEEALKWWLSPDAMTPVDEQGHPVFNYETHHGFFYVPARYTTIPAVPSGLSGLFSRLLRSPEKAEEHPLDLDNFVQLAQEPEKGHPCQFTEDPSLQSGAHRRLQAIHPCWAAVRKELLFRNQPEERLRVMLNGTGYENLPDVRILGILTGAYFTKTGERLLRNLDYSSQSYTEQRATFYGENGSVRVHNVAVSQFRNLNGLNFGFINRWGGQDQYLGTAGVRTFSVVRPIKSLEQASPAKASAVPSLQERANAVRTNCPVRLPTRVALLVAKYAMERFEGTTFGTQLWMDHYNAIPVTLPPLDALRKRVRELAGPVPAIDVMPAEACANFLAEVGEKVWEQEYPLPPEELFECLNTPVRPEDPQVAGLTCAVTFIPEYIRQNGKIISVTSKVIGSLLHKNNPSPAHSVHPKLNERFFQGSATAGPLSLDDVGKTEPSCYFVMELGLAPGTRYKGFHELMAQIGSQGDQGWKLPEFRNFLATVFSWHDRTKQFLFGQEPKTYAYCQNKSQEGEGVCLAFGDFGVDGLNFQMHSSHFGNQTSGAVGSRKFQALPAPASAESQMKKQDGRV